MNNFIVLHNSQDREILVNPKYIVEVNQWCYEKDDIFQTKVYYEHGSEVVKETVEEIKKMLIKNDSNIE